MSCNNDCEHCQTPCSLARLAEKLSGNHADKTQQNKSEEIKMSEHNGLPGATCHTSESEKIAILVAENAHLKETIEQMKESIGKTGASTPLSTGIKTTVYASIALSVTACVLAVFAIGGVSHYAKAIESANTSASSAVTAANNAVVKSDEAKQRSDSNYIYLRKIKLELKDK